MQESTMEMQGLHQIQEIQNKINIHLNLHSNFDLFRSKVQQSIITRLTETIEQYAALLTTSYLSEPETAGSMNQQTKKLESLSSEAQDLKEQIQSIQNPSLKDLLKIAKLTDKLEQLQKQSETLSVPPLYFNQDKLLQLLSQNITLKEQAAKSEEEKKENSTDDGEDSKITEGQVQDYNNGYDSDLLMRLSRGNNLIYIYEIKSSKLLVAKLGSVKFEAKMASTQFKTTLFASGGIKSKNNILKDFYSFDGPKKVLSKLKPMIYPRMMHSLVAVDLNHIFAIGGMPHEVEVEYFQNSKWQRYPALNEGRCNFAACYLDNHLFVFCGSSENQGLLSSVQRSQIDKTPWIKLILQDNMYWKPQAWLSCVPLNPKEILLFRCDDNQINFIFQVESHNLRTYKAKGGFPETSGYWCPTVKKEYKIYVPNYDLPIQIKTLRLGVKQGQWETVAIQQP